MLTASQTVTIERHECESGLIALTFLAPALATADTVPAPLVFVLHGLGSRKERHLDLCLRLARAGFRACAFDVRLHGDRQAAESALLWGDKNNLSFLQLFGTIALETATEIGQIADEFGASEFGVVGHSMGGFFSLITALNDRRTKAIVNVAGSLDNRLPPRLMEQLPPFALEFVARLDPIARAAEFWPTAVLILHGADDATVAVDGAQRLYDALSPFYASDPGRLRLTITPEVGHEFTPEAAEAAVEFFRERLSS